MAAAIQRLKNELSGEKQAQVDRLNGETTATLIQSLDGIPGAMVLVGSLAVIKTTWDEVPRIIARRLTATETDVVARYPDILNKPEKFLDSLADGVRILGIEAEERADG